MSQLLLRLADTNYNDKLEQISNALMQQAIDKYSQWHYSNDWLFNFIIDTCKYYLKASGWQRESKNIRYRFKERYDKFVSGFYRPINTENKNVEDLKQQYNGKNIYYDDIVDLAEQIYRRKYLPKIRTYHADDIRQCIKKYYPELVSEEDKISPIR